ncbi:MAG TPA: LysM peptidoglycan-binding domain-containing protein [Mobilitalea sp.]|nr:LysM peptidoglycan-binding domain-containing protein [Mobilitalea sp.]
MNIYVVQPGDTIYSIATRYKVPVTRLIQDNALLPPYNLVVGQTIVILYPVQTYVVQEGDTLSKIADAHDITLMQLLRNNAHLSNPDYLIPGETINIKYSNNKGRVIMNGYTYPFISNYLLTKTLPFLTYLTIFNYSVSEDGEITCDNDDTDIIQTAKAYGVAPIMLISIFNGKGEANLEAGYKILNQGNQEHNIDRILNILRTKGYYGLNISFQFVNIANLCLYNSLLTTLTTRLQSAGYPVFVTINPRIRYSNNNITFPKIDYSSIANLANDISLFSYDWSYSVEPPGPSSLNTAAGLLKYVRSLIYPKKFNLEISDLGYDWQLPYKEGSRARSLSCITAISLANDLKASIKYNEALQTPYFEYTDNSSGEPIRHIVWFKDARSVAATLSLLQNYGLQGIDIWNIMYFFPQMWAVINSQYEIVKVLL